MPGGIFSRSTYSLDLGSGSELDIFLEAFRRVGVQFIAISPQHLVGELRGHRLEFRFDPSDDSLCHFEIS